MFFSATTYETSLFLVIPSRQSITEEATSKFSALFWRSLVFFLKKKNKIFITIILI